MKNFGKLALLGAALAVSASYAHATVITASDSSAQTLANLSTLGLTLANVQTADGAAVATDSGPFNAIPNYTAAYTESVYKGETAAESPSGSACASCLAYVFTFSVSANAPGDGVETWTLANMFDGGLNANNVFDVGTSTLSVVTTSGVTIQFGGIGAETAGSSETIIDFTSLAYTTAGNATSQDGMTVNAPDLAPTATPEPSSLMLLGTGLFSGAGMLMRRRRLTA